MSVINVFRDSLKPRQKNIKYSIYKYTNIQNKLIRNSYRRKNRPTRPDELPVDKKREGSKVFRFFRSYSHSKRSVILSGSVLSANFNRFTAFSQRNKNHNSLFQLRMDISNKIDDGPNGRPFRPGQLQPNGSHSIVSSLFGRFRAAMTGKKVFPVGRKRPVASLS